MWSGIGKQAVKEILGFLCKFEPVSKEEDQALRDWQNKLPHRKPKDAPKEGGGGKKRAAPTCSVCKQPGHNKSKCPRNAG